MDVRCERCKTLYELDDARVAELGTTVRCTTCGYVFRVRKKILFTTEAVPEGGESTAIPPPVAEKPQWRVRSPSGRVIAFRELTSMQKWIIERKFGRDDEISLHGGSWKRLGDIAELQPFFLLLDEVDRVRELEARLRRAELPDEAPNLLERELVGVSSPAPPPDPGRPTPTPIRLESPVEPLPDTTLRVEPRTVPEPRRIGTPSAFSPDDATMPSGTIEPPTADATTEETAENPDQPAFTRRAGLGVGPGLGDDQDWEPRLRRSKAPLVATLLGLAAVGAAVAAYFQVWVPAQEEKLRIEAERARVEGQQRARAADEAQVQERERRAKEELVAGLAGRSDAGVPADAGITTGATPEPPPSPRGASDGPGAVSAATASMTGASRPVPEASRPRPPPADPRARTFEDWMALGDKERARHRSGAAVDAYDRAIAIDPERPEAHVARGQALLAIGNPAWAAAAFHRALELNPRYSVADFWLGEAFRRVGQKKEAINAYGRYLEAAPDGAEAGQARAALKALQE
jgi:predicted Zn finger-like uncharacterized protein